METFFTEYSKQLRLAVETYPTEYPFGLEDLPKVLESVGRSIYCRTYSKDSRVMRATCRSLGIKCTYGAINHYLDKIG